MTRINAAALRALLPFAVLAALLAAAAAGAMVLFLAVQAWATGIVWQDWAHASIVTLLVTTAGGLAVGLCLRHFGDHVGLLQQTIARFERTGRFEPEYVPSGLLIIFLSLIAGASLGPEVAAIDMGGGMGTWLGGRTERGVRYLSIAGICGTLGGFAVYLRLAQTSPGALYTLPPYAFALPDLIAAAILGLLGAGAGALFIGSYHLLLRLTAPLAARPVLRGGIGGAVLGLIGIAAPLVLFSGQLEFPTVLAEGAAMGATMLIALVLAKIFASTWCMATVFKGGPVFPLIFAGGTLGMAASLLVPVVPPAVAVPAAMAGMIVCMLKEPAVVIVLLALVFQQWDTLPAIIVATVAGAFAARTLPALAPAEEERA
jgi:H+/Cl- antiporter ClcA